MKLRKVQGNSNFYTQHSVQGLLRNRKEAYKEILVSIDHILIINSNFNDYSFRKVMTMRHYDIIKKIFMQKFQITYIYQYPSGDFFQNSYPIFILVVL